jgi:predicted kinase
LITNLQSFYASKNWRTLRQNIITNRGLVCEHCNKEIIDRLEIVLHHKIELNEFNFNDAMISLNPENIMLIHNSCHNLIHDRYKSNKVYRKAVYVVYGSPLSGKSLFVNERAKENDLIVDYDNIFKAISINDIYNKPDSLMLNARAIYNLLIDNIKTRYGKWENAFIVGGFADKYKRDLIANECGAELIYIESTKEECLARLEADINRDKEKWKEYIDKWWAEYSPHN